MSEPIPVNSLQRIKVVKASVIIDIFGGENNLFGENKHRFQRSVDLERAEEIFASFHSSFQKDVQVLTPWVITICVERRNEKHWLVDGQHRLMALKDLLVVDGQDENISCMFIDVENEAEVRRIYKIVNNCVEVPDIPESIDPGNPEAVVKHFMDAYPKDYFRSKGCHRPRLEKDKFVGAVAALMERHEITNPRVVINAIETFNKELCTAGLSRYKTQAGAERCLDIVLKIAAKEGSNMKLFVGIFAGYTWLHEGGEIDDILEGK